MRGGGEPGFDPADVLSAVRDAGFGPRQPRVIATGQLEWQDGAPRLRLPGGPGLVVLVGDEGLDGLAAAELPAGSRLRVEGLWRVASDERPAAVEVDAWEAVEASDE